MAAEALALHEGFLSVQIGVALKRVRQRGELSRAADNPRGSSGTGLQQCNPRAGPRGRAINPTMKDLTSRAAQRRGWGRHMYNACMWKHGVELD